MNRHASVQSMNGKDFCILQVRPEIKELAKIVFDDEEIIEVLKIAKYYCEDSKNRKNAIKLLRNIVPTRPKRPLYYVNYEIKFLPKSSRRIVENMGSYIDLLIKELRYEIERKYYKKPLGKNIYNLKEKVSADLKDLFEKILLFNKIAYVPSKHEYRPPNNPRHYFSTIDTIIIILSAVKLGEELKKRSQYVRDLCQDLFMPGRKPYEGNHKRTDSDGIPFDFKEKLTNLSHLIEINRALY